MSCVLVFLITAFSSLSYKTLACSRQGQGRTDTDRHEKAFKEVDCTVLLQHVAQVPLALFDLRPAGQLYRLVCLLGHTGQAVLDCLQLAYVW